MTATVQARPRGQWMMAFALLGVLAVAMAPLPPVIFDLLIGVSLCLAALTFLVAFYVERPTEFSSFPSLLLFVTLFRLALNVASTRLILTGNDAHAAGAVIAAFGHGLALAAPIVLAALIGNIALAVMNRAAPAVNVFSVALSVVLILGGIALLATAAHLVAGTADTARAAIDVLAA